MGASQHYTVGQTVIYPTHGVGEVIGFTNLNVAGENLDLIDISFERGMKLQVPTTKAENSGLRGVSSPQTIRKAFECLRGMPRVQDTIWARRAKEFESKVNSGDLIILCSLLRDLAPRERSERGLSYSERIYFETAMKRVSKEIAAAKKKPADRIEAEIMKALTEQKIRIEA